MAGTGVVRLGQVWHCMARIYSIIRKNINQKVILNKGDDMPIESRWNEHLSKSKSKAQKMASLNVHKNSQFTKNLDDVKFLLRCTVINNMESIGDDPVFQKLNECYFSAMDLTKQQYDGFAKCEFVNQKINGYKLRIMLRRMDVTTYNYLLGHNADDLVTHFASLYNK